jgi:outer membrane protein LpxR
MLRLITASMLLTLSLQMPAQAQVPVTAEVPVDTANKGIPSPFKTKRRVLGYGRLTTNDVIGDGQDRWRTGSVTMSRAWGYEWNGSAPSQLGQLLETRIQGQIIAPDNLTAVNLNDRPYAGVLTVGVHTYASNRGLDYSLGVDLAIIGPQTRIDQLQTGLHKLFGKPVPDDAMLALQIPNQFRPTFVAEMGRIYDVGQRLEIRPFGELRVGDETLARVGVDFTLGSVGRGELLSRESITGQRYRLIYGSGPGTSFVIGGDIAFVSDSVYLPAERGFQVVERRDRFRAGFNWQGENASVFYGVTYLSPEFERQNEGQVAGSVRVKLRF